MPCASNIFGNTPRPEPYIESMANLKFAPRMRLRSANLVIASIYAGFRSTSSMLASAPPVGAGAPSFRARCERVGGPSPRVAPPANSSSIDFMIAGVAEPPNLALNFTPFQFQGLWLEVTMTPPAAPHLFTLYATARA